MPWAGWPLPPLPRHHGVAVGREPSHLLAATSSGSGQRQRRSWRLKRSRRDRTRPRARGRTRTADASIQATSTPSYPSAARITDSSCFPQYTASLKLSWRHNTGILRLLVPSSTTSDAGATPVASALQRARRASCSPALRSGHQGSAREASQGAVDAHIQCLKRAMDLSMKHQYVPDDLQVKYESKSEAAKHISKE
ncbi:hypothetical protein TRIUR3_28778 [Triticum urartu]|uniref:Uncharacterized protein n=1 Tax=Triticum urartu TaxID=4572 RepID=M7YYH9_TRIUA|nr:hypothetical protein TRIUR3_28778 [Triticum urartu]